MRLCFPRALIEPVRQFVDRIVPLVLDVVGNGGTEDGDSSEKLILVIENVLEFAGEIHVFGPDGVHGVFRGNDAPSLEYTHDVVFRLESFSDMKWLPGRLFFVLRNNDVGPIRGISHDPHVGRTDLAAVPSVYGQQGPSAANRCVSMAERPHGADPVIETDLIPDGPIDYKRFRKGVVR